MDRYRNADPKWLFASPDEVRATMAWATAEDEQLPAHWPASTDEMSAVDWAEILDGYETLFERASRVFEYAALIESTDPEDPWLAQLTQWGREFPNHAYHRLIELVQSTGDDQIAATMIEAPELERFWRAIRKIRAMAPTINRAGIDRYYEISSAPLNAVAACNELLLEWRTSTKEADKVETRMVAPYGKTLKATIRRDSLWGFDNPLDHWAAENGVAPELFRGICLWSEDEAKEIRYLKLEGVRTASDLSKTRAPEYSLRRMFRHWVVPAFAAFDERVARWALEGTRHGELIVVNERDGRGHSAHYRPLLPGEGEGLVSMGNLYEPLLTLAHEAGHAWDYRARAEGRSPTMLSLSRLQGEVPSKLSELMMLDFLIADPSSPDQLLQSAASSFAESIFWVLCAGLQQYARFELAAYELRKQGRPFSRKLMRETFEGAQRLAGSGTWMTAAAYGEPGEDIGYAGAFTIALALNNRRRLGVLSAAQIVDVLSQSSCLDLADQLVLLGFSGDHAAEELRQAARDEIFQYVSHLTLFESRYTLRFGINVHTQTGSSSDEVRLALKATRTRLRKERGRWLPLGHTIGDRRAPANGFELMNRRRVLLQSESVDFEMLASQLCDALAAEKLPAW